MVATKLVVGQVELRLSAADLFPLNAWLPPNIQQRVFGGRIPKSTEMIRLSRDELSQVCAGLQWVVDNHQAPSYWDSASRTLHTVAELEARFAALGDSLSQAA